MEYQLIKRRAKELFHIDLKDIQLQAIHYVLFQRSDLILIAKTGFGKSIIFQAASLIEEQTGICLILMPLKALQDEQCEKLKHISSANPFVLNGDSNNQFNRKAIREGQYTHIFTSPEIATSKRFNEDVLTYRSFSSRLQLLAIDELHLVSEWKDFRPQYSELCVLQSRIPANIPVLGVSATLDPQTLHWVKASAGFDSDVKVIRTSIDRPEIFFQVSCIQESEKSMLNLQSILPQTATQFLDVPKTIVYVDSVAQICKAVDLFRTWMRQLRYPAEAFSWVAPYFSDMAAPDKHRIDVDFRRCHQECSSPRIILATDAYGLGVDNPDVELVVQWLLPPSIQRLYQRMGRAMRCGRGKATFILMHQPWCVGERSKHPVQKSKGRAAVKPAAVSSSEVNTDIDEALSQDEAQKLPVRRTAPDRRRDMPAGLYDIINSGPDTCIRTSGLRFFDDETYSQSAVKPQPCCSNCDVQSRHDIAPHPILNPQASTDSLRRPWFRNELSSWRTGVTAALSTDCGFMVHESVVMADEYLEMLAKWGSDIVDEASMLRLAGPWTETPIYCKSILEILKTGRDMSIDDSNSPAFQLWMLNSDGTKRQKRFAVKQTPAVKSAEALREERRNTWLLGKGVIPVSTRSTQAGQRNSPQSSNAVAPTSSQIESSQQEALQPIQITDGESAALRVSVPIALQRKRRPPLAEIQANEASSQTALPDSQFGRKRRRPAHLDPYIC